MRNLKRVLSLALALVMVLGMMVINTSAAAYTDADEITFTEAVDVATGLGLFEGYDDGEMKPTVVLTREQAATLITRIMLGDKLASELKPTKQIFSDVPTTKWSAAAIEYCYNIDMIDGLGDGSFDPSGELTGTAFAKLLLCAMGYDAAAEGYTGADWKKNIHADALAADLLVDGVNIAGACTREVAAQMILQALEADMVEYTNVYESATDSYKLVGPNVVTTGSYWIAETANYNGINGDGYGTQQFCEKYFANLKKTDGEADNWGRPADHAWVEGKVTYANIMKTPVLTFNVATSECDIAKALKLRQDTTVDSITVDGTTDETDSYIDITSYGKVGAQGQLVEFYYNAKEKNYDVVIINTYLAKVTDVEEVEYDKNGHIEFPAELDLTIYNVETNNAQIGESITLTANENWEYTKNEMLLVYWDVEGEYTAKGVHYDYAEILGAPVSMVGTQTAFTTKADAHIVEDTEIMDAEQFNLDQAGLGTTDHTWYFDQYGNLIGATDPRTVNNYATITSIYWQDSFGGENGYARTVLTYMDGTQETVKVYAIDGDVLYGVEGKTSNYADGSVSSTKQYNESYYVAAEKKTYTERDYTNVALYEVASSRYGLVLTTVAYDVVTIETGVPALSDDVTAGKSTQFLVWDEYYGEYTTYTGIRNVPTFDGVCDVFYVNGRDEIADYIFVIDPTAESAYAEQTYYWNGNLTVKTFLYANDVWYYSITGGYVNGEKATIYVADLDIVNEIKANKGVLMMINTADSFVYDVYAVTDVEDKIGTSKAYAVYAGDAADAKLADGILTANGASYDVDEVAIISDYGYSLDKTFDKIEDGALTDVYLYVIYTYGSYNTKVASLVYVSSAESLTTAQEHAVAELVEYIDAAFVAAGVQGATVDYETDISTIWGKEYATVGDLVDVWTSELCDETKYDTAAEIAAHLAELKTVFTNGNVVATYVGNVSVDLTDGIDNAVELLAMAAEIPTLAKNSTVTYELKADIDLAGVKWTPINMWNPEGNLTVTIEGNGHTIYNMSVSGAEKIGFIGSCAGAKLTINDLTFVDAEVIGSGNFVGTVIGYNYSDVTLNDVTVAYSVIKSTAAKGGSVGGLIGFDAPDGKGADFVKCASIGNTIVATYQQGGLCGRYLAGGTTTDCVSEGNIFYASNAKYVADIAWTAVTTGASDANTMVIG